MLIYRSFIIAPIFAAAILLLAACFVLSGCYTFKQGITMLGYLNRAIPLESLRADGSASNIDDPDEAEKNRLFAETVMDIRSFAMEELGLKMSKNYTRYVQIDRDYLAAVVSACAKDSFKRHEWKYPVVGAMPYKGFFNVDDARTEQNKLEKKGLDVWIRGVDAFSTLGWFKDPLYSYMRSYSVGRLADLIIHELLHATVFIKGQTQFNEELAEFIGNKGSRLYIESRYGTGSDEYQRLFTSDADNQNFVIFLQGIASDLEALYSSGKSKEEKLAGKEQIIQTAKERFDAEYDSRFTNDNYRFFSELPVNNAYLDLYRLYYTTDNFFEGLYQKSGEDLNAFIAVAKTLAKKDSSGIHDPRIRLEKALGLE